MIHPHQQPDATLLLPCLNEAEGLRAFLAHCLKVLEADPAANWRLLLADNGSTDGSPGIARSLGVDVLPVPQRGYGAALHAGISRATTEWVVYADADSSYRPEDAVKMLALARAQDADLVLGSRLAGVVHPGAMPWSHRFLGTPVLSFLLRALYGVPVTDCNSGIRCVRTKAYARWKMRERGMEFASSLLIRAAAHGSRVLELPVELKPTAPKRRSHLRTWTDGMRHLLLILAGSPNLFWRAGAALLALSLALALPCLGGIRHVFQLGIFGPHTLVIALFLGFYGALAVSLATLLHSRNSFPKVPRTLTFLLGLSEGVVFWWLVATLATSFGGCLGVFLGWRARDYDNINYVTTILFCLYLAIVNSTILFGIFQAHLGRRP